MVVGWIVVGWIVVGWIDAVRWVAMRGGLVIAGGGEVAQLWTHSSLMPWQCQPPRISPEFSPK